MSGFFLLDIWSNGQFCNNEGVAKAFQIGGYVLMLIRILAPAILIIMASYELGKAVLSSDDKAIKSAITILIKRAIAGVVIFFIPTVVDFTVALVDRAGDYKTEYSRCTTCLNSPSKCNPVGERSGLFTYE